MPLDTRQRFLTSAQDQSGDIYDPLDFPVVDSKIMDKVIAGVRQRFPIANERYVLDIDDLNYASGDDLSLRRQKEALLNGESLSRRLRGRWTLKDAATGSVVSKSGLTTIANVPVLTERGTFIRNGNELALVNMFRLNPGVYHRIRNNGQLEAHVNPEQGSGMAFKIEMDPDAAVFNMRAAGKKIGFYDTVKALGATDAEIEEVLGKDIATANMKLSKPGIKKSFPGISSRTQLMKVAQEIGEQDDDDEEDVQDEQASKMAPVHPMDQIPFSDKLKLMKLDPRATELTLGRAHPAVTYKTLLDSAKRLLSISRGEADPDKRDSMEFQKLYSSPDYFSERIARDGGRVARNMLWKATNKGNLDFMQAGSLNPHIDSVFNESGLSQYIDGSSPVEALDNNTKITRLGEGGISSTRGAPEESRLLQDSYKNFVDPAKTVDRMRVGLDMYMTHGVRKGDDGLMYNKFMDAKTGETKYLDSHTASRKVVSTSDYISSMDATVPAFFPGKGIELVPKKTVDYFIPDDNTMYSMESNTVPMKGSAFGLRVNMGSKYPTQAMPLVNREAPLVRTADGDSDMETSLGRRMGVRQAPMDGVVTHVDEDMITMKTADGKTKSFDLYNNFPVNKKGYMHSYLNVKAGQPVRAGDVLAYSNYTDKTGAAALGTNLRTAYVNWKGANYEDACVISESAAKKMTSQNIYRSRFGVDDGTVVDKNKFRALYPGQFSADQYKMVDDIGLIKPGTVVNPGDPLILGYVENAPSPASMGRKITVNRSETWDNDYPGIVTDVKKGKNYYTVYVRADVPMQVADKLSNRQGGKGVVADILKDSEMPADKDGRPYDILMSPLGILTRQNPAALMETAYGRIAEKTGKSIAMPSFSPKNMIQETLDALKQHGLEETEDLTDPTNGRPIPGVFTGTAYYYKLKHTAESKESARGADRGYTMDETPMLGSEGQAKRLGSLEVSGLIGHGAREVLRDAKLIKGQANDEFWRSFREGETPQMPGEPLIHKKFYDTLRAAGVNISNKKDSIDIFGMTDKDVRNLTGGREVKSSDTYSAKDLRPAMGGLFDPNIFGQDGSQWGYIGLKEPVLNPIMEGSVRAILGLTEKKFNNILSGEDELPGRGKGVQALISALDALNPKAEADRTLQLIKTSSGAKRDSAMKKFRALVSIEKQGLQPADFFLSRIPVLPPKFRQISSAGDTMVSADANYMYKRLMDTVADAGSAEGVLPDEDVLKAKAGIYDKYRELVGMHRPEDVKLVQKNVGGLLEWVFGKGSAKTGAFHRRLTSMSMDLVGRGTVVPNPALKLNQIGLPESQAWDAYEPFIVRKLVQRGYPVTSAVKMVSERKPEARAALKESVHERPVLMNRAPSLHKYSIMAFWPVLTKGRTIQTSPSIVKPMNMDFDGDEQINSVYINLLDKDVEEHYIKSLGYKPEWFNQRRLNMAVRFNVALPYVEGGNYYLVNLEDFPFNKEGLRGIKDHITFYDAEKFIRVVAYDEKEHKLVLALVDAWSEHKDREVWTITLSDKRQIISDDDPRAVYGIKKGTLELTRSTPTNSIGMLVPLARNLSELEILSPITEISGLGKLKEKIPLDKQTGYVIGALAGDGWYDTNEHTGTPNRVNIAGIQHEVVNQYSCFAMQLFKNENVHIGHSTGDGSSYGKSEKWIISSTDMAEWVAPMIGKGAKNKHIPPFWFSSPRDFKLGLLSGMLDTDGTISISNGKSKPQLMLSMTSISLRLLQEFQHLLLTLGVSSRISYSKTTTTGNACWVLTISSVDIQKIKAELNIAHTCNIQALNSTVPDAESSGYVRTDIVPITADIAKQLTSKITYKVNNSLYCTLNNSRHTGRLTRAAARRAIEIHGEEGLPAEWLRIINNDNVTWQYVESVENTGKKETGYDLTVPGYETFMSADGIILSNTVNFYVPTSTAAVKEAINKMMPEHNLINPRGMKVQYKPEAEYQQGVFLASKPPAGMPKRNFRTRQEAKEAYRKGEIGIDEPVNIMEK